MRVHNFQNGAFSAIQYLGEESREDSVAWRTLLGFASASNSKIGASLHTILGAYLGLDGKRALILMQPVGRIDSRS